MKNLTNHSVRARGRKDLYNIFLSLGFKDGLKDKAENNEFSFWYNKSRDGYIGNYLLYEIIDSNAVTKADNVIISRDFFCQIDIFSVNSFESKTVSKMLEKLENLLAENNYSVTMEQEEFENTTRLYHGILFVSKLYF